MKIWFFILFFSLSILQAKTINGIEFDGLIHLSEEVAKDNLGFEVGDRLSQKSVNESIKRFYQYGYFTDIYVNEENGVLTYFFREKSVISRVEVEGYGQGDANENAELLQIKKGTLYDKKKVDNAVKRIKEAVAQEGYIDTIVEVEKEELENGSVELTFKVNKGENIIIEKLSFEGMTAFEGGDFDDIIANKEKEFMGWFWGQNDGEMKLNELKYDPLRIRDLYMQHGYLDVNVDDPFVRVDFNQYKADMSYTIKEGNVYDVEEIILDQSTVVIEDEKIREVIKLEIGEPFNIKTFREDSDRIKTIIADLGYAYVRITPDLKKNREEKKVKVIYKIIPGKKVYIRDVKISGNTRTLDRVARREIYLAPGDLYSATDLKDSRNSLQRMGYFESTTIEEKRVDDQTMDLIVKVKETQTGNIQLGGGYGSFGGILISASISDRNIWGSGINMGFSVEKSERTKSFSVNVSNPRLNDSDYSGSASIFANETDYNDDNGTGGYVISTQGLSFGLGKRLTRFLSANVGYTYSLNEYSDISDDINLTAVDTILFENYTKSAISMGLRYDNTDDYYMPREGFEASTSFEFAGVGGSTNFIKNQNSFKAYQGVENYIGFDLILRYKSRFNHIFYDDSFEDGRADLPTAERFYMGGVGSVRGYESYSLSPRDFEDKRIGGTTIFANSVEASFPLIPKAKLRITAFYDYGVITGKGQDFGDATSNVTQTIARSSTGAAIEWFSPMGPIQLIFAQPLDDEPGDETSSFEFTIGQRF